MAFPAFSITMTVKVARDRNITKIFSLCIVSILPCNKSEVLFGYFNICLGSTLCPRDYFKTNIVNSAFADFLVLMKTPQIKTFHGLGASFFEPASFWQQSVSAAQRISPKAGQATDTSPEHSSSSSRISDSSTCNSLPWIKTVNSPDPLINLMIWGKTCHMMPKVGCYLPLPASSTIKGKDLSITFRWRVNTTNTWEVCLVSGQPWSTKVLLGCRTEVGSHGAPSKHPSLSATALGSK